MAPSVKRRRRFFRSIFNQTRRTQQALLECVRVFFRLINYKKAGCADWTRANGKTENNGGIRQRQGKQFNENQIRQAEWAAE
jgi:hypothetical protein